MERLKIVVYIDCTNAAFEEDPDAELKRLLHQLADRFYPALQSRLKLVDTNGNTVGTAQIEEED